MKFRLPRYENEETRIYCNTSVAYPFDVAKICTVDQNVYSCPDNIAVVLMIDIVDFEDNDFETHLVILMTRRVDKESLLKAMRYIDVLKKSTDIDDVYIQILEPES